MTTTNFARFDSDCIRCRGLCCSELWFLRSDGFPHDKPAGAPCQNLAPDFRCAVHDQLSPLGLKGCRAYECFGAGPLCAEKCPPGNDRTGGVFQVLYAISETLWYLSELPSSEPRALLGEGDALRALPAGALLDSDWGGWRGRANACLKAEVARLTGGRRPRGDLVGRRFQGGAVAGADLCMALLLGADLSGCSLGGTALLGADLRDADLSGADLSGAHFLTQRQVNAARGDAATCLPPRLQRPLWWGN